MEGICMGEYGVGQKKMKYLEIEYGLVVFGFMCVLKQVIDFYNIMNLGKIIVF